MVITAVDRDARRACEELAIEYPRLPELVDIAAVDMDFESAAFRRGLFLAADRPAVTQAYVCVGNDALGVSVALSLSEQSRRMGRRFPIALRLDEHSALWDLLADRGGGDCPIAVFDLVAETCRPALLHGGVNETLARAIHEDYVHQQLASDVLMGSKPAMAVWKDLPEELRESNRHQASHVFQRLSAFGYRVAPLTDWDADEFVFPPETVEQMASMEHERWCEEKRAAGWTWGEPRDDARKKHPDLVPYEELPDAERQKDRDAVVGLPKFLGRAGFQIEREVG